MRVLVLDQFSGVTPHWLEKHGMTFDALVALALREEPGFRKPQVLEVDESYTPPFATTTFRAAADGSAEVWRYRWDSSG